MRNIILFFVYMLFSANFIMADDDRATKDASQLPLKSREFLSNYFSGVEIAHIVIERNFFRIESYEVFLMNGTDVEFNRFGEWVEIDGNHNEISASLIPDKISDYVRRNYARNKIASIERERHKYKIKLNSGLELVFNKKGIFLGFDD